MMTILAKRKERCRRDDEFLDRRGGEGEVQRAGRPRAHGPQTITRNGRTVVVVAAEEWERKTRRTGNLAELLAASPLRGSKLKIHRLKGGLRKAGL